MDDRHTHEVLGGPRDGEWVGWPTHLGGVIRLPVEGAFLLPEYAVRCEPPEARQPHPLHIYTLRIHAGAPVWYYEGID